MFDRPYGKLEKHTEVLVRSLSKSTENLMEKVNWPIPIEAVKHLYVYGTKGFTKKFRIHSGEAIPTFDSRRYWLWTNRIETILRQYEMFEPISSLWHEGAELRKSSKPKASKSKLNKAAVTNEPIHEIV